MSHYKPYPVYKDSGVEWLGRVPSHWVVTKVGRTFAEPPCYGVLVPDFEADGVPMLRITDMEHEHIDKSGLVTISQGLSAQYSRTIVQKGDVVLSVVGTIGKAFKVSEQLAGCNLSRAVARIQPSDRISADYLCKIFDSSAFTRFVDLTCLGSAQRVLNMGDLSGFHFCVPVLHEQLLICSHLDRETARIDALIEKKTRFIELLREKRQALITHAVTKGLDPNVKMKDSGVEWLGEVPEHWVVSRLRHNIDGPLSYGANEAAESDEPNDPRFIRITDLHEDGTLREDTFKSLPWSVAQPYLLSDGDVLLARSGATVGKSFIYRESMGPSCYAGYLIRARLLPSKLISQYFWLCTQSTYYWDFIAGSNIQATIQNVSGEKYANLWLAVPPIKEQQRIINFLEEACDRLDSVRVKTERSIELLKERRSALITAAVTGQIDLREAV